MTAVRRDPERFPREQQVRRLKRDGDWRWRKAAQADLGALADDDEGTKVLAAAISAMLNGRTRSR